MKRFVIALALLSAPVFFPVHAQPGAPGRQEKSAPPPLRPFSAMDSPQTAKRQVGSRIYDLSKLFSGELVPDGSNTPWAKVSGKFVRIQSFSLGWVVDGAVNNTTTTFVLRNPPQQAMDEFKRLQTRHNQMLADFKEQTGHDFSEVAGHQELLEAAAAFPAAAVAATNNPAPRSRQDLRRQLRQALIAQQNRNGGGQGQAKQGGAGTSAENPNAWLSDPAARQLAVDISKFDGKGYDLRGAFTLECYAIKTTEKLEKMPVYDRGKVVR